MHIVIEPSIHPPNHLTAHKGCKRATFTQNGARNSHDIHAYVQCVPSQSKGIYRVHCRMFSKFLHNHCNLIDPKNHPNMKEDEPYACTAKLISLYRIKWLNVIYTRRSAIDSYQCMEFSSICLFRLMISVCVCVCVREMVRFFQIVRSKVCQIPFDSVELCAHFNILDK